MMCEAIDHIKLCTCDNGESVEGKLKIDKKSSYWTLKRFKDIDWMDMEMGRCFVPNYNTQQQINSLTILESLNKGNCFDFDFVPGDGDILNVFIYSKNRNTPENTYEFNYSSKDGEWTIVESLSLELNQKLIVKEGRVELSIEKLKK